MTEISGAQPDSRVNVARDTPKKIKDAAMQFEALLFSQMMKSARDSEGEDKSSGSIRDMADQQFSQVLASGGGLGLARLIVQGLADKPAKPLK
jgi:Rod binding protein